MFKKKELKKVKGFTLVEILVVIFIVGILSMSAVNGYTSYRRNALLDLSSDSVVSQINALRDKTIHGDFGSGRSEIVKEALKSDSKEVLPYENSSEALCFGIEFNDSGDGFSLAGFDQQFQGHKVWDIVTEEWKYSGCGLFEPLAYTNFELDDLVKVEKVSVIKNDESSLDLTGNFYLRFSPPEGEAEIEGVSDAKSIVFGIRYGEGTDKNYTKDITFDLK